MLNEATRSATDSVTTESLQGREDLVGVGVRVGLGGRVPLDATRVDVGETAGTVSVLVTVTVGNGGGVATGWAVGGL
jgi:hypothetical protein